MRYTVNLSLLFTDLPLERRPEAAKDAGFDAVEFWWPFPAPEPGDKEVERFLRAIDNAGMALTGLNFDAGDMPGGERGLVSLPGEQARFRANVPVAVEIARRTGCRVLNALYGNRQEDSTPWDQDLCAVDALGYAASAARGVADVVLEPLNTIDNPRYPVAGTAHALDVIERVRDASGEEVGLLYDVYHMQRMEGNLIDTIRRHAPRMTHVQVADSPGRGAPGTGEIAFPRVLDALSDSGYQGLVGLEYKHTDPDADPFGWLLPAGRGSGHKGLPSAVLAAS